MQKSSDEIENKELIHVPQGRIGRLLQSVDDLPFDGLVTYGFNSCSAIVFINKSQGKISLIHADQMFHPDELVTELQWAGDECDVIILHHAEGTNLMTLFQQKFPVKRLQVHCLADEIFGMSVGFNASSNNTLHPLIALHTRKQLPKNICTHPHEFELINAHKIQRLFFVRSLSVPKISRIIFSGRFWTTINSNEYKPRPMDDYDKRFLQQLSPKGYFESGKYVATYVNDALAMNPRLKFEEDLKDFCLQIGVNISCYQNQFDLEKCLQLDVAEILTSNRPCKSEDDKQFIDALRQAIRTKKDCDSHIATILKKQHTLSPEIDKMRREIKGAMRVYKDKKVYTEQKLRNNNAEKTITQLSTQAKEAFIAKDYAQTLELYQQCLALALRYVTNEEKVLATYCYNVGRSAQFAKNHILAYRYISLTINLYRMYHAGDKERYQKAMHALEELIKVMIVSDDPEERKIAENFVARNAHMDITSSTPGGMRYDSKG